jgi:hypothetical protein
VKRTAYVLAIAVLASATACAPEAQFRLAASDDNNRAALAAALAQRTLPAQPEPVNAAHQPRVFVVLAGSPRMLAAYDLAADRLLWKMSAEIESRVQVGGDFIVEVEHKQLVARDQVSGVVRWKAELGGAIVGVAADRDRAYAVWRHGAMSRLQAYDGTSGAVLWSDDADGELGAPTARGGIVYSPFFAQWLSLLDARTGKQLVRLRGIDDQISIVRATSAATYYGSHRGMFLLDARSASGKRDDSSYGKVQIPPQLDRTSYGRDMYDAVQVAYTAADRARVLWTAEPGDAGPMRFANDSYAIHYFRYVFGFSSAGQLEWAYQHPRFQLVASETTGRAILAVAQNGELIALDPRSGGVRLEKDLGLSGTVLGATFDADGWAPAGEPQPLETTAQLFAIARDHDARFDNVKEYAVQSLAKLPGGEVTKDLLAIIGDKRAPQKLKDTVAELLVQRKDPASLPVLAERLAAHTDFLAHTEPEALGPVTRAISGLAGSQLDKAQVAAAVTVLQTHLDAATTPSADLVLVITAMSAIGGGSERAALASHLLLYHADDDLGQDAAWCHAIVVALHDRGGPAERELLHRVALDARTRPVLVQAIRDAIGDD